MVEVLVSAFESIRRERDGGFSTAFDEARKVLMEFGEEGIADRILREASADIPGEDIADLLGILCWTGRENGAGIHRDADQWLRDGTDQRRLYVALHLESFPFRTSAEMRVVLSRIAEAHSSLRERCMYLIEQRREVD